MQGYLAAIAFTDTMIGRLIDALDKSPYKDNTIVVLWGDHGWHLGEKQHWRKFTLWEEATRAPLIFVAPGVTKPGRRLRPHGRLHEHLSDAVRPVRPADPEARGRREHPPLLAKPDAAWDRPALTTYIYKNHAVRTEQWRYIRYHDGGEELYDESQGSAGVDQPGRQARNGQHQVRAGPLAPPTTPPNPRAKKTRPRPRRRKRKRGNDECGMMNDE